MAYGLMQQHARPTRPQHHFHLARRSLRRTQLQQRRARRFPGKVLRALSPAKKSRVTRPPPPLVPRDVSFASFAITLTFNRANGCVSLANVPSDAATRMRRSSSLSPARTCVIRGSKSRAALSARLISSSFAAISASDARPAIGYNDGVSTCRKPLASSFAGPLAINAAVRAALQEPLA